MSLKSPRVPFPVSILAGEWRSHLICGYMSPHARFQTTFGWFSYFCKAHQCIQHAHIHKDHGKSVTTVRNLYCAWWCSLITNVNVYTPWVKKTRHLTLAHNFTKYWPIFKILSLLDSVENFCQSHMQIPHHTLNLSLHHLVKYLCSTNRHS